MGRLLSVRHGRLRFRFIEARCGAGRVRKTLAGLADSCRAGDRVSADFAGGAGSPPRRCLDGKPELTEAPWLRATAAEGIPEGFRQARPGRVAPGGAEARSPSPARNESGRDRNPLEILKSQ